MTPNSVTTTTGASTTSSSSNLYNEIAEMGDVSFLMYTLSCLKAAARMANERCIGFTGIDLDESHNVTRKSITTIDDNNNNSSRSSAVISSSDLDRTYTPFEIKTLIQKNIDFLKIHFPSDFSDENIAQNFLSLDELENGPDTETTTTSTTDVVVVDDSRPYTIEEFDDSFQESGLVYSVVKDSHHKRITLVFRGTESKFGAFCSNWMANLDALVTKQPLPAILEGKIKDKTTGLHRGYQRYLFQDTNYHYDSSTSSTTSSSKFDQIVEDVNNLMKKYPSYQLFVTGHSLGGGLATMCAFFLACHKDIPKPVTCISFAAPRVGTRSFLRACQYLEKTRQLKILRVMNHHDTVTVLPVFPFVHVGFQIFLYKHETSCPKLLYPNLKLNWLHWLGISWENSIISSLNCGYDHSDYRERLDLRVARTYLENLPDLGILYQNKNVVGYELEPL